MSLFVIVMAAFYRGRECSYWQVLIVLRMVVGNGRLGVS